MRGSSVCAGGNPFAAAAYVELVEVFMKIILDVMGADRPAKELIQGAVLAKSEYQTDIVLVGNERIIREALTALEVSADMFEIVHSDDVITMEDSPMSVFQTHKDSSMAKTLKLVADGEGDAAVSAGNTGAYFTGATLIVRRIHGIRRAALGTILPFANPVMMLDCGANVTVTPEYLAQFACLGSVYMEKACGITRPRVGLVNNGAEEHKGTPLYVEAYHLLKEMEGIHFVGNVEGKDFPYGKCDVLVCHGEYHFENKRGTLPLLDGKGAGNVPFGHDQHAVRRACAWESKGNEAIFRRSRIWRRAVSGTGEAGHQSAWKLGRGCDQKRDTAGHYLCGNRGNRGNRAAGREF